MKYTTQHTRLIMPCDVNNAASACKCVREAREYIKWDCVQQEVCDMNIMNEDEYYQEIDNIYNDY